MGGASDSSIRSRELRDQIIVVKLQLNVLGVHLTPHSGHTPHVALLNEGIVPPPPRGSCEVPWTVVEHQHHRFSQSDSCASHFRRSNQMSGRTLDLHVAVTLQKRCPPHLRPSVPLALRFGSGVRCSPACRGTALLTGTHISYSVGTEPRLEQIACRALISALMMIIITIRGGGGVS